MSFGFGDQTSSTNQTSSSTSSGTQSSVRNLTPFQSALQGPTAGTLAGLMTNPTAQLAPILNQNKEQVNSNYTGLYDALRQQFLGTTAGGGSGKYGEAALRADLARRGALADTENNFASTAATLPINAAALALNFLGQNYGSTVTQNQQSQGTGTQNTDQSGFNVGI